MVVRVRRRGPAWGRGRAQRKRAKIGQALMLDMARANLSTLRFYIVSGQRRTLV